jgi:5-methylcytosine-specific restriction endonuclease McrA
MREILPTRSRLKLNPKNYTALHRQILERDNWRCQACGSMRNLEVHHIQFRSHSGPDIEQNLMTLCAACHQIWHKGRKKDFRAENSVP